MFGSYTIHESANSLNISNHLETFFNSQHQLQEVFDAANVDDQTKQRWLHAGQVASDFLYEHLIK